MCGIAGVWASPGQVPATALAGRMIATLGHRGPDSSGVWADSSAGVQLAHARLAIIDLSPAGAQPMVSHDGRLVIVLNGEIYNHAEIRRKLAQHEAPIHWRGSSDTETLLQAICALGLDAALELAVGMFAFALYDTAARTLTLVRDRFGEKPLYWGWTDDGAFVFASELKALRKHPAFGARIDPVAVQELLTYAYISAPRSIYMGVQKLEPGGRLVLHSEGRSGREARLDRYFSLHALLCSTQAEPYRDERTALDELEAALMAAVARQSVADVPVGAFLSGGIDSSLIVSLMQAQASRPVETFTISFAEAGFDESPHAAAVAAHLGTNHHTIPVTAQDAFDLLPRLPEIFDEPFADRSQVPTFFVAQAARQGVTVALTGDAGDELFCGYPHYFWPARNWNRIARLPVGLRRAAGTVALGLLRHAPMTTRTRKARRMGARLRGDGSDALLFDSISADWFDAAAPVRRLAANPVRRVPGLPAGLSQLRSFMAWDMQQYMSDDILAKVDRTAMANSLETRVPFLDPRVVEVALRLPDNLLVQGEKGKIALRRLLDKHVPTRLIDRPKTGFGTPIGEWLIGRLRPWAESLLDPVRMAQDGFLDAPRVTEIWDQHRTGRLDWTQPLWSILMFQAWKQSG